MSIFTITVSFAFYYYDFSLSVIVYAIFDMYKMSTYFLEQPNQHHSMQYNTDG